MAVTVQVVIIGISLFYLPALASPIDWLYAAPRALFDLAGSASASASSAISPSPYIADLRTSDLQRKQEKFERLQNEKDVTDQKELDTNGGKEGNDNGEGKNEGNNEASPSFLEKKIGKILTKLRLIAQIKNAFQYKPEDHEHESDITLNITSINQNPNVNNDTQKENIDPRFAKQNDTSTDIQEPKVDVRLTKLRNQAENIEPKPDIKSTFARDQSENIQQEPYVAYGVPNQKPIAVNNKDKLQENEPLRVQLDVNQINNNLDDFNVPKSGNLKEQEAGKFGTLGVFFAELLGSVVGLAYGALAQLTSGGQSPVTVGTSEGL